MMIVLKHMRPLMAVLLCILLLWTVGFSLTSCDKDAPPSDTTDITETSAETTAESSAESEAVSLDVEDPTAPATPDADESIPTEPVESAEPSETTSETSPETQEVTAEETSADATEATPDETADATEDSTSEDTAVAPDGDTTQEDIETATEEPSSGEVITLPEETVPEPDTNAQAIPRLDIYTDNQQDVTSKDYYLHGTATLSNCSPKFAFEDMGVNIRARGNSTFHAPKKPFRLKFDEKMEMLGLNGGKAYKSWVLMADYYDGSMLRTYGTFKFAKALMKNEYYSSDCTHVEVYLNGEYRGVYLLCEQTQINRGRVDIPEMKEGDTSVEQGYLMIGVGGQVDEPELVTVRPEITVRDRNGNTQYYSGVNFTLSGGTYTQAQKNYVSNYVSGVFKVVASAVYDHEYYNLSRDGKLTPKRKFEWAKTEEEKQIETISAVFNLESAVSMCILDEICKNLDAMAFNMYVDLSPEGDGILTLAAPWDFDFSMANTHYGTTHSYTGFYATNLSASEGVRVNLWYVMLGSIPWFEDMICEKWQASYTDLKAVVADMVSVNYAYDEAFNSDWDRWGHPAYRSLIHHHCVDDLVTFEEHADAGNFVTDWLTMRLWWLNKQWGDGTDDGDFGAEEAPDLQLVFEDEDDLALIDGIKRCTVELTKDGLLLMPTVDAYDPYFSFDYDLLGKSYDAMIYSVLEFTYKIPKSNSADTYVTELFLCTGGTYDATGGVSTRVEVIADGQWHTVRIDLSETGFWMGTIHEIRFDFFSSCAPNDRMFLKEFKLMTP